MSDDPTLTDAARAVAYADQVIGDRFHWSLSSGCIIGNGPRFCFSIWPSTPPPEGEELQPLAIEEHDDPLRAVMDALQELGLVPERAN